MLYVDDVVGGRRRRWWEVAVAVGVGVVGWCDVVGGIDGEVVGSARVKLDQTSPSDSIRISSTSSGSGTYTSTSTAEMETTTTILIVLHDIGPERRHSKPISPTSVPRRPRN